MKLSQHIANEVDVLGFDFRECAAELASEHRSTQQSVMRLCMAFIHEMAKNCEEGRCDDRNRAACELAKKISDAFSKEDGLPLV